MNETQKREKLIERLIHFGVFKINNRQLFEISIQELEKELKKVCSDQESLERF